MSMMTNTQVQPTYLLHDVLKELECSDLLNGNENTSKSKCGLKIVSNSEQTNNGNKMVTYKKNTVKNETITTLGLFRSIIFNAEDKIICFAPPKAMAYDDFRNKYPDLSVLMIDEFIDGTMMNVYYDAQLVSNDNDHSILGGGWHISTRKSIGADNSFYRYSNNYTQRTFGDMFKETFMKTNINTELLDKSCCYSFVMRHPENRVVSYVNEPELYLTDVFQLHHPLPSIVLDGLFQDLITPQVTQYNITRLCRADINTMSVFINSTVKFPKSFMIDTYEQLEQMVKGHSPDGTLTKGYMIRCPITNLRTKIIPEEYNFVKDLRGNFADLRLLFLTLHREQRIQEYLHYYPENYQLFSEYNHILGDYINCMHMLYIDCFISKAKSLSEYPANFRTHMYKLHGIYKQYYQPIRGHISYEDVVDYVNDLDIPLLFNTMFVPQ